MGLCSKRHPTITTEGRKEQKPGLRSQDLAEKSWEKQPPRPPQSRDTPRGFLEEPLKVTKRAGPKDLGHTGRGKDFFLAWGGDSSDHCCLAGG